MFIRSCLTPSSFSELRPAIAHLTFPCTRHGILSKDLKLLDTSEIPTLVTLYKVNEVPQAYSSQEYKLYGSHAVLYDRLRLLQSLFCSQPGVYARNLLCLYIFQASAAPREQDNFMLWRLNHCLHFVRSIFIVENVYLFWGENWKQTKLRTDQIQKKQIYEVLVHDIVMYWLFCLLVDKLLFTDSRSAVCHHCLSWLAV